MIKMTMMTMMTMMARTEIYWVRGVLGRLLSFHFPLRSFLKVGSAKKNYKKEEEKCYRYHIRKNMLFFVKHDNLTSGKDIKHDI